MTTDVSIFIDLDADGNPVAHEIVTYDEAQTFTASPQKYAAFMAANRDAYHSTWAKGDGSRSLYKLEIEAPRLCEFCGDPAPEGWIADGRPACVVCNGEWLNQEAMIAEAYPDQVAEDWQTYAEEIRIR
jgi:hypothetical protein